MSADIPREPGEDVVAWRNRCLRAQGRFDVQWRYKPHGGGTELVHTHRHRPETQDDLLEDRR